MAFIAQDNNLEDEDKQQAEGAGTPAVQGQIVGGQTAPIQAGGATAQPGSAATAAPKATASGSFTKLQSYLDANKGNDAAMGSAVKNTVAGAADNANNAGGAFKSAAESDISQGTLKDTGGLTNTFNSYGVQPATAPTGYQAAAPGAASNPGKVGGIAAAASGIKSGKTQRAASVPRATVAAAPAAAKSPLASVTGDQFNNLYNGAYTGKGSDATAYGGYGDTQAAFSKVQNLGQMAGPNSDFQTRGQLLGDTFARGGQQYRQGEKTLDSFILGGGEQGAQSLQDINQTYGNYGKNFSDLESYLNESIGAAKASSGKTRDEFRAAADGAYGRSQEAIQAAATKAAGANEKAAAHAAALKGGDVDAWASALGMTPEQYRKQLPKLSGYTAAGDNVSLDHAGMVQDGTAFNAGDFAKSGDVDAYNSLASFLSGAGKTTNKAFSDTDLKAAGGHQATLSEKEKADLTEFLGMAQGESGGKSGIEVYGDVLGRLPTKITKKGW